MLSPSQAIDFSREARCRRTQRRESTKPTAASESVSLRENCPTASTSPYFLAPHALSTNLEGHRVASVRPIGPERTDSFHRLNVALSATRTPRSPATTVAVTKNPSVCHSVWITTVLKLCTSLRHKHSRRHAQPYPRPNMLGRQSTRLVESLVVCRLRRCLSSRPETGHKATHAGNHEPDHRDKDVTGTDEGQRAPAEEPDQYNGGEIQP